MTEKPQPLPTQIATPSQAVAPSAPSQPDPARKVESVEEEPYTIKCICNFSDDDGHTIYCDTCDTWQHIDCFYPNSREEAIREDFAHSCAECKPRSLDIQKAIERTRRLKTASEPEETPDKKATKRPPSKSHKKKIKPGDLQLNGHIAGQEQGKHGNPGDQQPPQKKAKSSHRPSNSTSSQANKRSPSYGNGRPNGHPPSPATTPPDLPNDLEVHNYSDRFLSLYNSEPEFKLGKTPSNSFSSLDTLNTMSRWLREPGRMKQETGEAYNDVFQTLPADIDTRKGELTVQDKQVSLTPQTVVRWKYLTTPNAIEKDIPLIELHGQICFQKDYCEDAASLWEELSSPLPFVFFHPMLPLCIDTRNEIAPGRYVRRSCKPNAVLDTYLSNASEYHFWLVSDRYIAANEQITLPWDFRLPKSQRARMLNLIGLGDDEASARDEPDMDEPEYQRISGWLHRVLSEFGGCACELGNDCAFARFHRHYLSKMPRRSQNSKKKPRTPKLPTISPTSTGPAFNSRAASESHADDPDHDGPSASERSKPPSRDRTPLRQGSLDLPGILTEPTDRDKRKVQMVEDSFRRMEQQAPPRKKKRTSDGTTSKSKSKSGANPSSNGRYVDAATSRSMSGSPASAQSQNPFKPPVSASGSADQRSRPGSTAPRPKYCDAMMQTDSSLSPQDASLPPPPTSRRSGMGLSRRLLIHYHRARVDEEESQKMLATRVASEASETKAPESHLLPGDTQSAPVSGPIVKEPETEGQASSPTAQDSGGDIVMSDAPATSPTVSKSPVQAPVPAPVPALLNGANGPKESKALDLRVQLPPVPSFTDSSMPTTTTPLSTSASTAQSPFSTTTIASPFVPNAMNGIAQPSPIKKKLTLSDYTKSRMNKAAGAKPNTSAKAVAAAAAGEETKTPLDTGMDVPIADKAVDNTAASSTTGAIVIPTAPKPADKAL